MTTTLEGIEFASTLWIEAWGDPVIDSLGHDPRSEYAERFWLPVLGPSTTWLLRYFATQLDALPTGVALDMANTARSLGLGERTGRHAPFLRTVARAIDFDMARRSGSDRLQVRRFLPPLARRHLLRLPESLRIECAESAGDAHGADPTGRYRRHGLELAIRLLDLGESETAIERQLRQWHFDPTVIEQCLHDARSSRQTTPPTDAHAVVG